MPAWSLPGPILLALTAPAAGDGKASAPKAGTALRIVDVAPSYDRQPPIATRLSLDPETRGASSRDRRLTRSAAAGVGVISDPQADSVQALLRDRRARRGGALDARVEWRLSGEGSDVGLGGGLARMVDTLLHD